MLLLWESVSFQIKQAHGDYELIPEVTTRSKSGTPDTAASMSSFKIHSYLKSGILGRHGGELLADWKYAVSNPYIIGMIVCGSKVIIHGLWIWFLNPTTTVPVAE